MVKAPVSLPVTLVDFPHLVQSRCKNLGILEDGPVLDDDTRRAIRLLVNAELIAEKKQLGLECPALHILVKIRQVGIVVIGFIEWRHVVGAGEKIQQR